MIGTQTATGDLLWHYTGFSGLQGIIEQREIWASFLTYLNDTTEFAYTIDVFSSVLTEFARTYNKSAFPSTDKALAFLVKNSCKWTDLATVFTACFSKAPDDLSQWRAYAGRTPGFSVGF